MSLNVARLPVKDKGWVKVEVFANVWFATRLKLAATKTAVKCLIVLNMNPPIDIASEIINFAARI